MYIGGEREEDERENNNKITKATFGSTSSCSTALAPSNFSATPTPTSAMRIRKQAKIPPVLSASSYLKPGTQICQMNKSPWDVMCFSPPSTIPPPTTPSQVSGSDVSARNGSSGNCVSVFEREHTTWWQSKYAEEDHLPLPAPPVKNGEIVLCCKTDEKSWQCRREAWRGNSLCEHHLSLVKNYSTKSAHYPTKKSVKPAGETPVLRRHRPKKAPSSTSSSNPYEFYYYSGFGPRWGKKRGKDNCSNMLINVGDNEENGAEAPTISGEDFDYAKYDDDEEEEEKRKSEKKKVRKPIKARSLKSLM